MRAYINAASPFARKVRIAAREAGLISRIQEVDTAVSPVAPNADLAAANPLTKIPALVLEDGTTLFDSRVICEYLDSLADHPLFPRDGTARWQALRLQALCDGILDAAVLIRYENAVRPAPNRWEGWVDAQRGKIERGVAALEQEQPRFGASFGIGQIGAACVLGYLDFRFPEPNWRLRHPRLDSWFAQLSQRASIRDTTPQA